MRYRAFPDDPGQQGSTVGIAGSEMPLETRHPLRLQPCLQEHAPQAQAERADPTLGDASISQDTAWLASGFVGSTPGGDEIKFNRYDQAASSQPVASRRKTPAGSATYIRASRSTMASKGPPGAGSWMSPSTNRTWARPCCPARSRARATACGD